MRNMLWIDLLERVAWEGNNLFLYTYFNKVNFVTPLPVILARIIS